MPELESDITQDNTQAKNPREFYDYAHELYARYNFVYRCKKDGILDKAHEIGLEKLTKIYNFIKEHLASVNDSLLLLNISSYVLPWDSPPVNLLETIYKHSKRVGFYESAKIINNFGDIQEPLKQAKAYLEQNFTKRHYQEIHQMQYFTQLANAPYSLSIEGQSEDEKLETENRRKDFLILFYALVFYRTPPIKAQEIIDYIFTDMDRILYIPVAYIVLENRSQTFSRSRQVQRWRAQRVLRKKWWSWFKWHRRWGEQWVPYWDTEWYSETIYYMEEVQLFTQWRKDKILSQNPPSEVYKIKTLDGAWIMSDTRQSTSAPS